MNMNNISPTFMNPLGWSLISLCWYRYNIDTLTSEYNLFLKSKLFNNATLGGCFPLYRSYPLSRLICLIPSAFSHPEKYSIKWNTPTYYKQNVYNIKPEPVSVCYLHLTIHLPTRNSSTENIICSQRLYNYGTYVVNGFNSIHFHTRTLFLVSQHE